MKPIACKDRTAATAKATKLAQKEEGLYLIVSRKKAGKAYIVKLESDATFVGITDGRTDKTKAKVSK